MSSPRIVTHSEWLSARKSLLAEEKALTRARDALTAKRQSMPVTRVTKTYVFETDSGRQTLPDLFGDARQLIVMHFMFGRDWEQGCPSCSFWADGYDGVIPHLAARDTQLVAVSNAPLDRLTAYKERIGWNFPWVSAVDAVFSKDFGVTFDDETPTAWGSGYNFAERTSSGELPGASIFMKLPDGEIGHSYSTYARGLDMLNVAYQFLDLTPLGRNEDALDFSMSWVRRRDEYSR